MINVNEQLIDDGLLSKMGPEAFTIYIAIARHQNAKNAAWPGIKRLMHLTGMGRDRVYKALKLLIDDLQLIQRKQINKKGEWGHTVYWLNCNLIEKWVNASNEPLPENPDTENADTENADTENQDTEVKSKEEVKSNREVKSKEGREAQAPRSRSKKSIPESVEAVSEYMQDRGMEKVAARLEAEKMYDHYAANGWKQGKGKPILDWKAAARNWLRRVGDFSKTGNPKPGSTTKAAWQIKADKDAAAELARQQREQRRIETEWVQQQVEALARHSERTARWLRDMYLKPDGYRNNVPLNKKAHNAKAILMAVKQKQQLQTA